MTRATLKPGSFAFFSLTTALKAPWEKGNLTAHTYIPTFRHHCHVTRSEASVVAELFILRHIIRMMRSKVCRARRRWGKCRIDCNGSSGSQPN